MSKQIINVGATANDKSGDPLRTAFQKVNDNFTELYSSLGIDGTVFDPLNVDSHLIPAQNDTYDIGSPSKQWRSMYVGLNTLYIDNVPISLDNNGNLTVNGDIVSGTGAVTTGATPPENPVTGQLWWENVDTGRLYIYYNNSWVDASPIIGPNTGNWTFTGDTATVTGTTAQIGKNSSETITQEILGGTISQTTTNTSQVAIDASSIVITRSVTQVVDDGVLVATDEAGSVASIGNGSAYLKTYSEPAGPNNTQYAEVGTSGTYAYLESRQDDVGGYTLGGVVTGPGTVSITAHSTDDKIWLFDQEGILTVPESSGITGINDFNISSQSGDNSSGLFLNGNPLVGSAILYANNTAVIRSDNNGNIKDWNFDRSGTLTTPSLLPRSFTATVDAAHYAGEGSLTLEGDAWHFEVTFAALSNGTVETQITNNTPWPSNPGYANDMPFAFTSADHGIPGYTFTLTLVNIQNPGMFMYTTNLAASIAPTLPATISGPETIKLTADATSWTFSPDGNLTVPGAIKQGNSKLAFNTNSGTNVYLTSTTDDSTAVFINNSSVQAYATEYVNLQVGGGLAALELLWQELEQLWIDVRDQDAADIAPATRAWAGLPSYQAYDIIVATFPVEPAAPGNLVPVANNAKNAYNDWQTAKSGTYVGITAGGKDWRFDTDGNLTLPGFLLLPGGIGIEEDNGSLYMAAPDDIILSAGNDQTGSVFIRTNQETKEWEFDVNGALTVPGNINIGELTIQEGFPGLTVATGNNLAIGTSRYDSVSANAYIGFGDLFSADIEFNDDITVVQVGWILVGPDLPVSAVDASVGNQYRITVPGATFVTGTTYTFRNSTPTPYAWVFGNDGVLTTPASGSISHQNNDLKLEVAGTDVIVLRTGGGDVYVDAGGRLVVGGAIATDRSNAYIELAGVANETLIANNNAPVILRVFDSNNVNPDKDWTFGVQGNLTVPDGGAVSATHLNTNYLNFQTNSSIQVGHSGGGSFAVAMDRFQVLASPPTSSIGSDGDVIGCVAFSSSHIYYCTGLYDGVTNIWKRVGWSGDTW